MNMPATIETKNKLALRKFKEDVIEPTTQASISLDELLDEEFPEQEWLVEGLIPASAITIVSAPPNSYKTWSMSHLALSLASGEPFYGQFKTTRSGVLIIDEENGKRLLHKQLKLLGAEKGLNIRIRSRHNFTVNDDNIESIFWDCEVYGLSTVIFDSLVDIHMADENSAIEMAQVFKHFKRLAANGISVIIIHHNRKPGINSPGGSHELRGSGNILAQLDAHLSFTRNGNCLSVKPQKLRYGIEHEPFEVEVVSNESHVSLEYRGSTYDKDTKATKSAVYELIVEQGELNQKQLLELLKENSARVGQRKLSQILTKMAEEGSLLLKSGKGNETLYSIPPLPPELV